MTLVPEDLTKWDNESLLRAYEREDWTGVYPPLDVPPEPMA